MTGDQQAIFDLIAAWMAATRAGDLPAILDMMSEDVVFLRSGQPPMRGREAFAVGFKAALQRFQLDARSDIQEIEITGDLAYCWNHLTVTMTPLDGKPPASQTGFVLSVLRKETDGRWRISRDANLI